MNKATALYNYDDYESAVDLYDKCISIYRRLIDQEGRREIYDDLALALMNKANVLGDMGITAGAIKHYDECISIRNRLVYQEGRRDLLGDLWWSILGRAHVNNSSGNFSDKDHQQVQGACLCLASEVNRTGRADLKKVLASAKEEFKWLL